MEKIKAFEEKFKLAYFNDVLVSDAEEIQFYYVLKNNGEYATLHHLHGDVSLLGFSLDEPLTFKTVLHHIDTNNPYSEIYGADEYIRQVGQFFTEVADRDTFLMPFRMNGFSRWAMVKVKYIKHTDDGKLYVGEVVQLYQGTPELVRLFKAAYLDDGTDLFNREALRVHLENNKDFDHHFGLFLDLDDFKRINDTYGHQIGDELLKAIAQMFKSEETSAVTYYRLSGDEFFCRVKNYDLNAVILYAERLIKMLGHVEVNGMTMDLSASVGVTMITKDSHSYKDVLKKSDSAMYVSKNKGKAQVSYIK